MSKRIGTLIIILLILFFGWKGYEYLHYRSANAVSDAAFIKSDRLAMLSFKVDGKVIEMRKEENEPVRKGELLARIDPKDLNVSLAAARHGIDALEKELEALRLKKERLAEILEAKKRIASISVEALQERIGSLAFRIEGARKNLEKLERDARRYRRMLKDRLIAEGDYEKIVTKRDALRDDIRAMEKELDALRSEKKKVEESRKIAQVNTRQIRELSREIAAKEEALRARNKEAESLQNALGYTRLYAPFDGIIAKRFTVAPRVLEKGTPVYALVDPEKLYCEVLLSEKKLHGVEPGNEVRITVDAFKDRTYHGEVESIAPASASTFSLVPRDIASGEFTKLDQRFVVRIKLKDKSDLRAGMGATVAIRRR